MKIEWTPEKCSKLREMYNTRDVNEIAVYFGCSVTAIYSMANKIGLKKKKKITGRPWSDEHDRIMYGLWPDKKEIARRVGRSVNTVTEHARKNGLNFGRDVEFYEWTDEEDDTLKELYPAIGRKQTAIRMGIPEGSVKVRAKKFGLRAENINHWTDDDIALLKEKFGTCDKKEMTKLFHRSVGCIYAKAYILGLSREDRLWSDDEIELLKKEYPMASPQKLLTMFDRSSACIHTKAGSLGLKKAVNYMPDTVALKTVENKELYLQNDSLMMLHKAQIKLRIAVNKNRIKKMHDYKGYRYWTDEETDYLIKNHKIKTYREMATHLNRDHYSVASRILVLIRIGKLDPLPAGLRGNRCRSKSNGRFIKTATI